jgi:hypothetical protein
MDRGLIGVEPNGQNTLIAYAAKAGFTAMDGDGQNSPFALALLKHLTTPGLDLRRSSGLVRDDVLAATANKQEPYYTGSLGGEDMALVPAPVAAPAAAKSDVRGDYQLAERVGTKEAWDSFIAAYPSGFYADLAKAQRNKLAAETERLAATEKARGAAIAQAPKHRQGMIGRPRKTAAVHLVAKRVVRFKVGRIIRMAAGAIESTSHRAAEPWTWRFDQNDRSAPFVTVERAVDAGAIAFETDGAAFLVAAPDVTQRRELLAVQRGLLARGAEDDADIVAAGTIDRVPERTDFLRRHPVLRVEQHHGIDLARGKAFEELAQIGVNGNDQSGAIAHARELAGLQIGRQAEIAGTAVTAIKRLPGEIIGLVGMAVDQPQQSLVEHLMERRASAQQLALLGWNAQAEQQGRRARDQLGERRMKQTVQTGQRLNALRSIDLAVQQGLEIDPGQLCQ